MLISWSLFILLFCKTLRQFVWPFNKFIISISLCALRPYYYKDSDCFCYDIILMFIGYIFLFVRDQTIAYFIAYFLCILYPLLFFSCCFLVSSMFVILFTYFFLNFILCCVARLIDRVLIHLDVKILKFKRKRVIHIYKGLSGLRFIYTTLRKGAPQIFSCFQIPFKILVIDKIIIFLIFIPFYSNYVFQNL